MAETCRFHRKSTYRLMAGRSPPRYSRREAGRGMSEERWPDFVRTRCSRRPIYGTRCNPWTSLQLYGQSLAPPVSPPSVSHGQCKSPRFPCRVGGVKTIRFGSDWTGRGAKRLVVEVDSPEIRIMGRTGMRERPATVLHEGL